MRDEQGPVIGREMAAALDAEARRRASDPPASPLPPERYLPDESRLFDPVRNALDGSLEALVAEPARQHPCGEGVAGAGSSDELRWVGTGTEPGGFAAGLGQLCPVPLQQRGGRRLTGTGHAMGGQGETLDQPIVDAVLLAADRMRRSTGSEVLDASR